MELIETAIVNIDRFKDESVFDYLRELVSPEKRVRLRSFKNPKDRLRSLAGEHLVRIVLKSIEKEGSGPFKTLEDSRGKPYIEGMDGFHYNISHSGSLVACSWGPAPSGIDVEKIVPMDMAIARNYFSDSERELVFNADEGESLRIFFRIWTLKEAFVKCTGMGLGGDLKSFSTYPGISRIKTDGPNGAVLHFCEYPVEPGYLLSVCSLSKKFSSDVRIIEPVQERAVTAS